MTDFRIGTSSFTAAGWPGTFYPAGMQPRDFLTYYATKFSTVEIDSTFYHAPSRSTVAGWAAKTPAEANWDRLHRGSRRTTVAEWEALETRTVSHAA